MNNGGDAAEQVVRLSLEGFEVAAKLTGSAAKNVALLLVSVLKQEQQTKGKARLGIIVLTDKFGPAGRSPVFLPAPFQSRSFRDIISLHEKNEDTGRRKNAVAGRSPG